MKLSARAEKWEMAEPFRIAGQTFTHAELAVVLLQDGDVRGRGEACGVYYRGDTAERIVEQVNAIAPKIEAGAGRADLLDLLSPGGARHALDAALWEIEAARANRPVWSLAGLSQVRPLATVFTIGIADPATMARKAASMVHGGAIKLKLQGDGEDADRVLAVRKARPKAWLAVDANQGFTLSSFRELIPTLERCEIKLIEQPFPAGRDEMLAELDCSIPIAADESVQDIPDLKRLVGLVDIINIKLDKCGGLTRALAMEQKARRLGFGVMVGNMTGTSWSQAPAFILGQRCDLCDLDGPTFLKEDRDPRVRYADGKIYCADDVWGHPSITMRAMT